MRILAILLCAMSSMALAGEVTPVPVTPGRIEGNRLLLPEVEGSVDTPDGQFVWQSFPPIHGVTRYRATTSETKEQFLVTCTVDDPVIVDDKAIDEMMGDSHKQFEESGGTVIDQKHASVEIGPRGKVLGYSMTVKTPGATFTALVFLFGTGRNSISVASTPPDGQVSDNFKKLLASVQYRATPPPSAAAGDAERKHSSLAVMAGYFIIGAAIGALAKFLARALFKRSINGPMVSLFFVFGMYLLRAVLIDMRTDLVNPAEINGQEIGSVGFPIIVFACMAYNHSKAARAKILPPTLPPES